VAPETVEAQPADEDAARKDGYDLARGAAANLLVLLAANFRGVFTFLIARVLGEAALGRFGLMFAATELLSKAGMLGLDGGIVPVVATRAAAGDGEGARRLFRWAVVAALAVSVPLALIAVPGMNWLARVDGFAGYSGGMALMLLALPGIAVARISTGASRAVRAMRTEFYSRGLTETWVTTGVFVMAIALGIRDVAPAVAIVLGTTASGVVAFVLAARVLAPVGGSTAVGRRSTIAMLRYSAPIAGSSLVNVLVMRLDVLLLGAFVGRAPGVTVETFGVFCAATEIAGGMRKVRQVFDPIFAPVAATRAASASRESLRGTVAGPGRWVLSAQLPLVGVLLLASGAVLGIYGSAFRQGALWLALLGLAHGAASFAGLVETLIMIERPMLNLVNAVATVLVQLVAGLLLIPRFGVTGAALATLVAFAAQGVLRFVEVRHVFGWSWPWGALRRPLAAFAIAFGPALGVRLLGGLGGELLAAVTFLVLYAATWRVLGAEPADRAVWEQLMRTRRARQVGLDSASPVTRQ
jgi:O-antigen/teichoic acid export membrane protein